MTFKSDLEEIITSIHRTYQNNELAYLALTSKIELPLRDKIAFQLHKKYQDKYLICREWKSKVHDSLNRVDIAIINKSDSKVLCLIELKAKSVVGYQERYTRCFADDLIKIRDIAKDNSVELYYIYINNVLNNKGKFENVYSDSVKYLLELNRNISRKDLLNNSKDNWSRHLERLKLNIRKSKQITINAGRYYGRAVSIEIFIFGPVNKREIENLDYPALSGSSQAGVARG